MGNEKRRFEIFEGADGAWRYRLVAIENGRIVSTSGESFDSKSNAERAVATESSYYTPGTFCIVVK